MNVLAVANLLDCGRDKRCDKRFAVHNADLVRFTLVDKYQTRIPSFLASSVGDCRSNYGSRRYRSPREPRHQGSLLTLIYFSSQITSVCRSSGSVYQSLIVANKRYAESSSFPRSSFQVPQQLRRPKGNSPGQSSLVYEYEPSVDAIGDCRYSPPASAGSTGRRQNIAARSPRSHTFTSVK
jgi:hypothetical protein